MGDDEDTTVTKSDHASQTLAAIYQLYQCSLLCDTTLLVAHNVTLSAHRIVLVASSEYFKCRLCTDEEKHFESIPNVSTSAMNNLLDFMYTGSLNLNQSNVWLLLAAATQLQVSAAIGLCKNFLKQQIGQKGNSETTGHNVLIGFHCDLEDPKITVNGDNKDMLSPMDYVDKDLPEAASNKMCSKEHNHDQHTEDTQPCTFSCKSSNDTHRKETSNTIKNVGSNQPAPQVSVEEEETNRQRFDGPCSLESDNIRRESAVTEPFACVSTSDIHATVCDQALRKAEHSGKRKYVIRKKKFICKFCMKQFRYCSTKNLHVQLNHTLLSHQLRPGFSWRFMKNNIPETIQLPLPGGTVQYGCIACGAKFSLNSLYRAHFSKVHCENLKCNACIKLFQSRRLLVIHRASHKMAPAVGRMLCGHCHRPFIHRCAFEAHRCSRSSQMERRKHKNKNSEFLWVCPYCPRQFCYKKSFENHITNHKRDIGEKLPGKASSALPQKDGESSITCRQNGRKTRRHLSRVVKHEGETGFAGRRWKCEEGCSLVLPSHVALRQHMKQQHPLVVYQCAQCHYHTQINCMIARHMRLKHSNSREKTCDICGKHFSKPSCCKIHKYLKHNVDDPTVKVYYCEVPGCKYRTCQQCNLKTHQRKHDEDKPFVCSTCGKRLKTEKNLEKHVNKVHLRIRPFICDQCGQAYGEACELDVHMARHEHEKKYKCDQCDYATHVKADYHSHMFAIHKVTVGGTCIFHCSVCDYATDRRGRMRDHENCHLGIRNFCCSQCDKRFMTRATLVEHVRCMHTPKTLHCAHCSYVSSTRRHLAEHTRVMHTYRHVRPYQCMYCDYRSSISGNCRKHCKSKHRGMPVKWVKVCDKYPERSDGSATLLGGELYTEKAGMLGDTIQADVRNTESVEVSTTKVYLPVTLHSTLSVARPEFTSYDAQNTTYNTGQFLS